MLRNVSDQGRDTFLCGNWGPVGMIQGTLIIQSEWKAGPVTFIYNPARSSLGSQSLGNNLTPSLLSEAPCTTVDTQVAATCWPEAT